MSGTTKTPAPLTPEKAKEVGRRARQQRQAGGRTKPTRLRDTLPIPTLVTIRGVECELYELSLQDLAELDATLGAGTGLEVLSRIDRGDMQSMRAIAWVMLRQVDPELTEEEVGRLIGIGELVRFGTGSLLDTLLLASGLQEKTDDPNAPGAETTAPSTGSSSSEPS